MEIKENTKYKILGNSQYFLEKYKTSNPIIEIEGNVLTMIRADGTPLRMLALTGNWAAKLYLERARKEGIDISASEDENCYYGKINGHGEVVHKKELEEINE